MSLQSLAIALSWNWAFWPALTVYCLACLGAGLLVLRLLASHPPAENDDSPSAYLGLASVLGLGLLGQFWVLLALAGLLIRPVVYSTLGLMLVAAAVLGWQQRRALVGEFRDIRISLRRERLSIRVLLLAALASMVFTFAALGRPLSGDSLALHMMVSKIAAASGMLERNWFQPGNEYFGVLGEMTYAVLMQIGNEDAAQMITWPVFFAISAVLIGACQKTGIGLRGQDRRGRGTCLDHRGYELGRRGQGRSYRIGTWSCIVVFSHSKPRLCVFAAQ